MVTVAVVFDEKVTSMGKHFLDICAVQLPFSAVSKPQLYFKI